MIVVPEGAFPYGGHAPPQRKQPGNVGAVPRPVPKEFRLPKRSTVHGQSERRAALVSMPKATVNLDNAAESWKHDIRAARKSGVMQNIPKPPAMQKSPDPHFRSRVHRTNPGHHPAPGSGVGDIRHVS